MPVSCLHPVTLVNPSYADIILRTDFILLPDSKTIYITPFHRESVLSGVSLCNVFPSCFSNIDKSDVYFVSDDGVSYPFFIDVPCGKCNMCRSKHINSLIQRLNFGVQESSTLPLFLTLTYNDEHLPVDGVSVRDVQLFKKKLNKLTFQLYGVRLKYGVFSEYTDSQRPHYHILVYNFPYSFAKSSSYSVFRYISNIVQFCWRSFPKKGYKRSERFDFNSYLRRNYKFFKITKKSDSDPYSNGFINVSFLRSGNAFSYVTKYISKGSNVPDGKNPNFHFLSCNMGTQFVLDKRDYVLQSPQRLFVYTPKFSNKPKKCFLCAYYIRKLFPSYSKIVPIDFRRKWFYFLDLCHFIGYNIYLPKDYRSLALKCLLFVHNKFPNLCPYHDIAISKSGQLSYAKLYNHIRSYCKVIHPDDWYIYYDYRDSIYNDFYSLFEYFKSFPDNFDNSCMKQLFQRDLFLSGLKINHDYVLKAANFANLNSIQISKSKLF